MAPVSGLNRGWRCQAVFAEYSRVLGPEARHGLTCYLVLPIYPSFTEDGIPPSRTASKDGRRHHEGYESANADG